MTKEELSIFTSTFDDIKPLIEKRNNLLKDINKTRRRLKTQFNKYSFLYDLVGINANGTPLVDALVKYFKAFNFENVENVDKKYKDEDIRLFHHDTLIIIEVTGIDAANPQENKAHQITKHIPTRQNENPNLNVFGLFVVNHENTKAYNKRSKRPFSDKLDKIAKSHKYGLITTVDLFYAFLEFKNNKFTPDKLISKLCSTGIIKILGA